MRPDLGYTPEPPGAYAALAIATHADPDTTADVRALAQPDEPDANTANHADDGTAEADSDTGLHCHPETLVAPASRDGLVARALSKVGDYATSIVSHARPSALLIRWRTHSASHGPLSPRLERNPAPPANIAAPLRPVQPRLGGAAHPTTFGADPGRWRPTSRPPSHTRRYHRPRWPRRARAVHFSGSGSPPFFGRPLLRTPFSQQTPTATAVTWVIITWHLHGRAWAMVGQIGHREVAGALCRTCAESAPQRARFVTLDYV